MAILTDKQILQKVKTAIGVGGNYQDDTLVIYINEVKDYLKSAGVPKAVISSDRAIGIICRGVTDLWSYGPGDAKLSDYFMQRASQFALEVTEQESEGGGGSSGGGESGSGTTLTDEQLAKIDLISIYGDGSNVLTDSGDYVNLESSVQSVVDNMEIVGQPGADGKDGQDGYSPTITITKVSNGNKVTINDVNGTKSFTVTNGANGIDGKDGVNGSDGADGSDGKDGVGISTIEKTSTVGLVDTYTITMTDGTTSTFTVTNGKDGKDGTSGSGSGSVDLSDYYNKTEIDTKFSALELGDKNVQSDWNETNTSSDAYIKNKPTIPEEYDDTALAGRVTNLENNKVDKEAGKGLFSGSYNDLTDKPEIPSKVSELENDAGYITQADVESASTHTHANKEVLDGITAEKVESWDNKSDFDGDYNNLANKPTIPTVTNDLTDELKSAYDGAVAKAHSHSNKAVLDAVTSEKVASWDAKSDFSGSYNDLTDKPEIPSIAGLATETYVDNAVSSVPVYDDTAIQASITALQSGKADKTEIADFQTATQVESLVASKIAEVVANAPSDFDTLKEIADWISTHENSAAAMNTAIAANTNAIANDVVKKSDITISSTDIGEGASLATGALYFVYE